MYRRILVPVDGSKLAECVLPHVETLAKGCSAEEVILLNVTERLSAERPVIRSSARHPAPLSAPETVLESLPEPEPITKLPLSIGKKQEQANKYLNKLARKLQDKGIKVRTRVLLGQPAEEIAAYAENEDCDLIVMASHGRSGISRWAYGSVADKVFRASPVPVLMVKEPGSTAGT
ncbi:MAG: universal stress protein [Dehalococcoidales bacterium]|nr:universal stress protein [Dehalococcoidales bacterium]